VGKVNGPRKEGGRRENGKTPVRKKNVNMDSGEYGPSAPRVKEIDPKRPTKTGGGIRFFNKGVRYGKKSQGEKDKKKKEEKKVSGGSKKKKCPVFKVAGTREIGGTGIGGDFGDEPGVVRNRQKGTLAPRKKSRH